MRVTDPCEVRQTNKHFTESLFDKNKKWRLTGSRSELHWHTEQLGKPFSKHPTLSIITRFVFETQVNKIHHINKLVNSSVQHLPAQTHLTHETHERSTVTSQTNGISYSTTFYDALNWLIFKLWSPKLDVGIFWTSTFLLVPSYCIYVTQKIITRSEFIVPKSNQNSPRLKS